MQKKFCEKSQVFLEVKTIPEKRKPSFWGPYLVWLFVGKPFEESKEKQKIKATIQIPSHAQIFRQDARAIFLLRKFGETKNLYGNLKPQGMDTIEAGSCAVHMLENSRSSIGARKSSKMLIQYKHLKFALSSFYSKQNLPLLFGRFYRNFGELK